MALKTIFSFILSLFIFFQLQAQQLMVLNGGSFGSTTDIANLGVYSPSNGNYQSLDSIGVTSVQDLLIEDDRYAYVAASDSILKYDLFSGERIAAASFGGISTVHLELYNNQLLVGNYYGLNDGNLRIFDKSDLSFQDSIPEISKGATDFLVIGDYAYISQNNSTSNFQDTLGYLAIVDLSSNTFLRNDTLSTTGEDVGRLVNVGDSAIYSLNTASNTISYYHISSQQSNLLNTTVDLNPRSVGSSIFYDGNLWYFPYDNGIGSYDLVNNTFGTADIISIPSNWQGYAFAMDTSKAEFFLSYIDYSNQNLNIGIHYDTNGDSIGTFPVGSSPEILEIWYSEVVSNVMSIQKNMELSLFPNPTVDYFQIEGSSLLSSVELYGMNGRLIRTWIEPQNTQFDISDLHTGQYLLRIKEQEVFTTKILIKL